MANGSLVACGDNGAGQCNIPNNGTYLLAAAGRYHSVAWRSDGVFEQWGDNTWGQGSGGTPPSVPAGVTCTQLACGYGHTLALLSNGRVLAWGSNVVYESVTPGLPPTPPGRPPLQYRGVAEERTGAIALLSDGTIQTWGVPVPAPMPVANEKFVKVGAGYERYVALRADGTLVAWGDNLYGAATVPPLPPGVTYTDFSTCGGHTVALRSDGQAVQFGDQITTIPPVTNGLRYVAIDAEFNQTILLRSDHVVVYLGTNSSGQTVIPPPPPGLHYRQVVGSNAFTSGLLSDGSVVHWGSISGSPWRSLPPLPAGVTYVEISGGYFYLVARRSDGQVVVCGHDLRRKGRVPPLFDKTSYVQINGTTARVGPTTTYVTFANGCAGSRPASRLIPMDTPRIGRPFELNIFDLPNDVAVLVFGLQRTTPLSLAALGMPGCSSHITMDGVMLLVGQGGIATARIPVPNRAELIGLHFYQQAYVLDSGAGNAAGAVVSNAAEGVIGDV